MGQKQHSSENYYYKREYKEEEENNNEQDNNENNNKNNNENNNNENNNENNKDDDNYSEDNYSYEEIIKNLNHMYLSEQEVEDNYDFYKTNYEKLLKINRIIANVKMTNLYNLTPFEMLAKIVPKNELKILPSEYESSDNNEKIFDKAPINPEYVLPTKWEDLFNLKISDKAIDKLYKVSEIKKITKFYSEKRGESYEKNEKRINEENYDIYDMEIKSSFNNDSINQILEKLKFMHISEQEIKNNIWFYKNNCEKLIKINDIINKIKFSNFKDLSPQEVLEKIVPENELKNNDQNEINSDYIVPSKWEDLFYLETSDKALNILYIESKKLKSEQQTPKITKEKKMELSNNNDKNNILKELLSLEHFKKTEDEIKSNIDFYYNNYKDIIKVDNIITHAINGDLYDLTPSEAYKKVTGDNPDHLKLPNKWEDLFDLTILDWKWKTDILLATTKNHIKNKEFEKNRIGSNQVHNNESKKKIMDKNTLIKEIKIDKNNLIQEIKKLRYFKIKESEIKKNLDYYLDNFKKIKKINTIIENAIKANVYNDSPGDFIKDEKGIDYSFPEKWEDLFNLKEEDWKIDMLYNNLIKKLENIEKKKIQMILIEKENKEKQEKRKKEINEKEILTINELKKLKKFEFKESKIKKNIEFYIDNLNNIKKVDEILIMYSDKYINFSNLTPMQIYEKSFKYHCEVTLPKKWYDLFKLDWTTNIIDELYIATKIEFLKRYLSLFKLEKYARTLDYNWYDGVIKVYNYKEYDIEYNKYVDKFKRLDNIIKNANYILYYTDKFCSGNDKNSLREKAKLIIEKSEKMNVESDFYYVDVYEDEFERESKEMRKEEEKYIEKQRKKMEEEERERREFKNTHSNYNYRSNYSSSSFSNNLDLKKSYIKLCRYCKNKCVYCNREIKGSEIRTSKAFGLHNKCQINSCYICGSSKSGDDIKERQSSYLCKPCYNNQKLDSAKCLSCHKQFK